MYEKALKHYTKTISARAWRYDTTSFTDFVCHLQIGLLLFWPSLRPKNFTLLLDVDTEFLF